VIVLDKMLIGGIKFVLGKVAAAVESELNDDSHLRERLLEAQMQLELGEISDEEFAAIERDVLARIREIKGEQPGAITLSPTDRITGVDIEDYESRR
jgi:hypothetical protein